eukprot:scaffold94716_cov75-Phaeocystis_antarctica.AAC.1
MLAPSAALCTCGGGRRSCRSRSLNAHALRAPRAAAPSRPWGPYESRPSTRTALLEGGTVATRAARKPACSNDSPRWRAVADRVLLMKRPSQPRSGVCTPRSDGRCAASPRMLVKRTAPARSAASTQIHSESVRAIPPAPLT